MHWKRLKPRILAKKSAHALDARGGCDVTMVAKMNVDRLQVQCKWEMSGQRRVFRCVNTATDESSWKPEWPLEV